MTFKELRKRKFRTAAEFAAALGTTTARVQGWECGGIVPTRYLRHTARVLGVGLNTLLDCYKERER